MTDRTGFEEMSPNLARVARSFTAPLLPEAAGGQVLSVEDAYMLEPSMFVSKSAGTALIRSLKRRDFGSSSASSSAPMVAPGAASWQPSAKEATIFKECKVRMQKWDTVVHQAAAVSGRGEENARAEKIADELLVLMSDAVRERFLPGYLNHIKTVPREMAKVLRMGVLRLAGPDQLRSTRDALRRLDAFMAARFSRSHGFYVEAAVVGWFLLENWIVDEHGRGHVPQNLFTALVFAQNKLKFQIDIENSCLRSVSSKPTKTPKQAPSASVRMVHHFHGVACNAALSMPLRGAAAVFLVMALAALRGVDAQRSSFVEHFKQGRQYFSASAWNSKSREAMAWACPCSVFGSDEWMPALLFIWGDRDYMLPSLARGASLAASTAFVFRRATSYTVLKFLKEVLLLPGLGMIEEEVQRVRRHSFRHWLANCMRILNKFSMTEMFQGGRWKEQCCMPLRYSAEVKDVVHIDIIARVCDECEHALMRVGVEHWPIFGGWELLLPDASSRACPQLFEQADSDLEDSDSSDDEDSGPVKPSSRRRLPPGWERVAQDLGGGKQVFHYASKDGRLVASSVASAWKRVAQPAEPTGEARASGNPWPVKAGGRVKVWWYEDELWYVARIYRAEKGVAGEPESTALFVYELDDARIYHSWDDPDLLVLPAPLGSVPGDPGYVASPSDISQIDALFRQFDFSGGRGPVEINIPASQLPDLASEEKPAGPADGRCHASFDGVYCTKFAASGSKYCTGGVHAFPLCGKRRRGAGGAGPSDAPATEN